jgi:hypothetical protein
MLSLLDGVIDANDADFGKLRVWRDLNQNGASDEGELQSLDQAGVASISLNRHLVGGTNAGHGIGYQALFTRSDGTTQNAQTIYFQTDRQHSAPDENGFTSSLERQRRSQPAKLGSASDRPAPLNSGRRSDIRALNSGRGNGHSGRPPLSCPAILGLISK